MMLGGCTQSTRHANQLIFGTNTSFGLSVGKDIDTPAATVGYKRQELVLMPLVANEAPAGASDKLVPCKMSVADGATAQPNHPCLLVATRGEGANVVAKDSYSVLASFGASFDAGSGTNPGAKGGLAQYFATGMAAQLLALKGGAALVATGEAARNSALVSPDPQAVAALTGDPALVAALADPAVRAAATGNGKLTANAGATAVEYLSAIPEGAEFTKEIQDLDAAADLGGNLARSCAGVTKDVCLKTLPLLFAGRNGDTLLNGVQQRKQARGLN